VILRYPPRAHATTDPSGYCTDDHGNPGNWQRPGAEEPRTWQVVGQEAVLDERHGRQDLALAPGTMLRLDAVHVRRVRYPEDGPQPWGFPGDYDETERRFCVLDGPMAGTCWESTEAWAAGAGVPAFRENALRVVGRPHQSERS
jgi:hypothetical protein